MLKLGFAETDITPDAPSNIEEMPYPKAFLHPWWHRYLYGKPKKSINKTATMDIDTLKMYSREITFRAPVPSVEKDEEIVLEAGRNCGIDGTG